jgi:hypothetical protein
MIQQLDTVPLSPAVTDELELNADELKALARYLDALIEADFALKKCDGRSTND